jgi:hypothetical protein
MKWSEYLSTTDLFLMISGAFFTPKLWWISFTYNDRFLVLLAPQKTTTTHRHIFKQLRNT